MTELIIDCAVSGNWSAITGNVVKTGLGLLSMAFDILFVIQHYVLYRDKAPEDMHEEHTETSALLTQSDTRTT